MHISKGSQSSSTVNFTEKDKWRHRHFHALILEHSCCRQGSCGIIPMFRKRTWGSENYSDMPKWTYFLSGRVQRETHWFFFCWSQSLCFFSSRPPWSKKSLERPLRMSSDQNLSGEEPKTKTNHDAVWENAMRCVSLTYLFISTAQDKW